MDVAAEAALYEVGVIPRIAGLRENTRSTSISETYRNTAATSAGTASES